MRKEALYFAASIIGSVYVGGLVAASGLILFGCLWFVFGAD